MNRIVSLAGGAEARIVVIPNASADPVGVGRRQAAELARYGADTVQCLLFDRLNADSLPHLEVIRGVTGIFFSGGDQTRLTRDLNQTRLLAEIHAAYQRGAVIAGTSAGAAVMSAIMITGGELVNRDTSNAFAGIMAKNVATEAGFGFVDEAIIDQHFIKRRRQNRLLSLTLENPHLLGIGIDEATAIVVKPDRTFEVIGENTVMVFDARRAVSIGTDSVGNLAGHQITCHLLRSGQQFDLKTGKIIR